MNESVKPPQRPVIIGSDAMVATANGQGLSTKLDMAQHAHDEGRSTVTEKDVALLKSRVEAIVKQMIASGASDADIQKAVAGLAPNAELAGLAKDMAQQQLDAEKFNLFNTRNSDGRAEPMMGMVDMGSTTAAIAEMGLKGGFSPTKVPDVRDPAILAALAGLKL